MESKRDQVTIVPVLVGALKEGKETVYGKLFSQYLADPNNLFVVSSDFCHWGKNIPLSPPLSPFPLPHDGCTECHLSFPQAAVFGTHITTRPTALSIVPLRS